MKRQTTGMTGVYYVAAELSRRNYTALVTTRNTKAVDILASNNDTLRSVGIQVKTNSPTSPHSGWLLSCKDYEMDDAKLKNLVYIFVNLNKDKSPSYFVVRGNDVRSKIDKGIAKTRSTWYSISREDITNNEDKWDVIDSMTK